MPEKPLLTLDAKTAVEFQIPPVRSVWRPDPVADHYISVWDEYRVKQLPADKKTK